MLLFQSVCPRNPGIHKLVQNDVLILSFLTLFLYRNYEGTLNFGIQGSQSQTTMGLYFWLQAVLEQPKDQYEQHHIKEKWGQTIFDFFFLPFPSVSALLWSSSHLKQNNHLSKLRHTYWDFLDTNIPLFSLSRRALQDTPTLQTFPYHQWFDHHHT